MLNEPCQTKWMMTLSIKVKWIGVPHQENAQLLFWLTAQGSIADPTAKSTTLPPRPEPKRPHGGYMRSILESWSILESHQGIGTWRFTLPRIFFWCDSRIHWTACFLWAFVCKLASSSNSWNEPCLKTALRRVASMFLVNGSANCNAVGIHLKWQCSKHLSLIRSTSKVVRYSSHEGIARRLTKSYRDLQSVTTTAACIWRKASGGFLHWNSGITSVPHKSRHQLILSTLLDMLKASADKVERTTLEIFFDDHEMGLIGAVQFCCNWGEVANTSVPWKDDSCFGLANEASPNTTWVSWSGSIDLKKILTSQVCWASRRTLLASNSVWIVGFDSWTWISPSLAATSGRVFVVAYWRLPIRPRKWDISVSDTGSWGVDLLCLPISTGMIEFT